MAYRAALDCIAADQRQLLPVDLDLEKTDDIRAQEAFLVLLLDMEKRRRRSVLHDFRISGAFLNELRATQTERDPKSWRVL